jgi:hypothetical protein
MQTVLTEIGYERLLDEAGFDKDATIRNIHNAAFFVMEGKGNPRSPDLTVVYSSGIDFKEAVAA